MALTFECGICQAAYRLDEEQITPTGVKITCPKCLNYFLLKRSSETEERPVIERLVPDGATLLSPPPPPSSTEMTSDQLLTDVDLDIPVPPQQSRPAVRPLPPRKEPPTPEPVIEETQPESFDVRPTAKGRPSEPDTNVSKLDLSRVSVVTTVSDPGSIAHYLVPGSLIVLVSVALLVLNYRGVIHIPGLESFRPAPPVPQVTTPLEAPRDYTPRYGFPQMDPSVKSSWSESTPAPEISPLPEATAAASPTP